MNHDFEILSLAPTSHNNLMNSESQDGAYRECLLKVSRLLSRKDCAELTLRYGLNAELFTEPAAVIRALEQRDILSKSRPKSMLNVLTELQNEEALTLWKTFIDEQENAFAVEDISEEDSSDSKCGPQLLENRFETTCSLDVHGTMEQALSIAQNSRDWNTKVGAVIIHPQKDVVSTGFNHMPNDSEKYSWTGEGNWLDTKYPYVVEAAVDAVLKCEHRSDLRGAILITTLHPGNISAMVITEVGIKAVWYSVNKYPNRDQIIAGARILQCSNIPCKKIPQNIASTMVF